MDRNDCKVGIIGLAVLVLVGLGGCGEYEYGDNDNLDPTPEKIDGTSSYEFESDDIERAENASPEVQEYCDGAASEAQWIGCLSHVTEEDIP